MNVMRTVHFYIYLANGKKDKMEESFTPEIKKAADIFSNCSEIVLNYDSLNIENIAIPFLKDITEGC